jgi:hypothetical protein
MEHLKPGFVFTIDYPDEDGRIVQVKLPNLMPTAAINYMIAAAFTGGSAYATFYLGLYGNARVPLATDTMTTFMADCGEIVNYTGTARPAIVFPPVANGTLSTAAAPNSFTFAADYTVRGVFITTSPTWNGTSGLLVSARLLPSPKTGTADEPLTAPVGFSFVGGA